jgi:hypothetical protein
MGKLDFSCQECHGGEHHEITGSSLHGAVSSGKVSCLGCHDLAHEDPVLTQHTESVSCETCHIPAFSRAQATKMFWDWSTAGRKDEQGTGIKETDADGHPKYDFMKGDFVYEQNVRPTYAWWNGKVDRMLLGDSYEEGQEVVTLAAPVGSIDDPASRIHPFKVMEGVQGADPVNRTILVPHLFPGPAGPGAYWKNWDWAAAFREGMDYAGLPYSGSFEWVRTEMYLSINHEVAPKEDALSCGDCHNGGIDFTALGYDGDPMLSGGRE